MSVTVRHLPSRRGCLLTGLHVQIHNGCHQTRRLSSTRHGRPISSIPNTFSIPIPFQQEFKTRKTILFSHSVSLDTYKPCLFTLSSSSSTPRSTIFNKSNTSSSSPILNIARSLSDVIINQKQRIKKEKLDRRKTKLIISSLIPLPSQLGDVSKHGHVRHVNTDAGAGDKQASVTDKSKEQSRFILISNCHGNPLLISILQFNFLSGYRVNTWRMEIIPKTSESGCFRGRAPKAT